MACLELAAAFLAVHSYFAEDGFALADGLAATVEVYTTVEEPAAGVAWAGFVQLVRSRVVLDAVLLVVTGSVYCLAQ